MGDRGRPTATRGRGSGRFAASPSPAVFGPEDFPGCEPFHLPANEIERYEGRLEFWDARTEMAWKVCEPTTIHHERPARMLARAVERFAQWRDSRIECFGSADLLCRDERGRKRWLMQADEVVYLHPERSQPPGPAIEVVAGPLPDVVLEVDYTTEVPLPPAFYGTLSVGDVRAGDGIATMGSAIVIVGWDAHRSGRFIRKVERMSDNTYSTYQTVGLSRDAESRFA